MGEIILAWCWIVSIYLDNVKHLLTTQTRASACKVKFSGSLMLMSGQHEIKTVSILITTFIILKKIYIAIYLMLVNVELKNIFSC